jgi:hypothetical protein
MVIHAEIREEVSVTRISRHLVRKDIAISKKGFIVLIISRKQKVDHTIKTAISPITASHTFKTTVRSKALSSSALASDIQ